MPVGDLLEVLRANRGRATPPAEPKDSLARLAL
jgi:hypothetical protein